MEQVTTGIEIEKNLQQLFFSASNLFEQDELSDNYKQSFVFRCLNVLKGRDKEKFLWEIIRLLNSKTSTSESDRLIYNLRNAAITLDEETFFKHAYAFLLGIMKKPFNKNQPNS